jgi:hypothetical protein
MSRRGHPPELISYILAARERGKTLAAIADECPKRLGPLSERTVYYVLYMRRLRHVSNPSRVVAAAQQTLAKRRGMPNVEPWEDLSLELEPGEQQAYREVRRWAMAATRLH